MWLFPGKFWNIHKIKNLVLNWYQELSSIIGMLSNLFYVLHGVTIRCCNITSHEADWLRVYGLLSNVDYQSMSHYYSPCVDLAVASIIQISISSQTEQRSRHKIQSTECSFFYNRPVKHSSPRRIKNKNWWDNHSQKCHALPEKITSRA